VQTVSLKFEPALLTHVEEAMKKHNYTTKTEFIREAVRDKLFDLKKQEEVARALHLYGAPRKKTTDKQLHKIREIAVQEIAHELGVKLY